MQVDWYTYYAGGAGGPTAIKQARLDHRVFAIAEGMPNSTPGGAGIREGDFRAKHGVSLFYPRAVNEMRMLVTAMQTRRNRRSGKVAAALEGMKFEGFDGGKGIMRKDDHQLFQTCTSPVSDRTDKEPFDEEETGWGWKQVAEDRHAGDTVLPTTCKMERPN